jgi:hypothetical protein
MNTSEILRHEISYKSTDVSEVLTAHHPDDEGGKLLYNVSQFFSDYKV